MSNLISPVMVARNVLKTKKINNIPVDVEKICATLGIQIQYVDFSEIENKIGKKISGAIQKSNQAYTIFVNEDELSVRSRFAIAHELGHYYLHRQDDTREFITSFRGDKSSREKEANKFAAELLMPRKLLEQEYTRMVIPISDSLAKKFHVPKSAMRLQLDNLKLMYI